MEDRRREIKIDGVGEMENSWMNSLTHIYIYIYIDLFIERERERLAEWSPCSTRIVQRNVKLPSKNRVGCGA